MTESSFQHWWTLFLNGDRTAFGRLYTPFHQKLMLYCYKYLRDEAAAEDAASETLHKLYEYPQLESVRDFERWLFTCARNLCLDQLAKNKRRGEIREEIKVGASTYNKPAAENKLVSEDYQKVVKQTLSE
ncbi:MAG: sigma factor, partial [Bacteroidota bacterium]